MKIKSTKHSMQIPSLKPVALASLFLMLGQAMAQPIQFNQIPDVVAGKPPAPNILISLDNSGSMLYDDFGCPNAEWNAAYPNDQNEIEDHSIMTNWTPSVAPADRVIGPCGNLQAGSNNIVTTLSTRSKRIDGLKAAINSVFGVPASGNPQIQDKEIRLGWQVMNTATATGGGTFSSIADFTPARRTEFINFVNQINPKNGTPSHQMFTRAHQHFDGQLGSNPWKTKNAAGQEQTLACRRSYHIFMTDGIYNEYFGTDRAVGDADSTGITLPDGVTYTPNTPNTRLYSDGLSFFESRNSTVNLGTLADHAFDMWARDYQPTVPNTATPIKGAAGNMPWDSLLNATTENGITGYWNPRNNPMTWQGVTTYTIGYGSVASRWNSGNPRYIFNPNITNSFYPNGMIVDNPPSSFMFRESGPQWDAINGHFGSTLTPLVNGTAQAYVFENDPNLLGTPTGVVPTPDRVGNQWPNLSKNVVYPPTTMGGEEFNTAIDLWHAALNGRGKFYPATSAAALQAAFRDILETIRKISAAPVRGFGLNSSFLSKGSLAYRSNLQTDNWSGSVTAHQVTSDGVTTTPQWDSAAKLDAASFNPANRLVLSHNSTQGINMQWNNLSAAQQTALGDNGTTAGATLAQNRLDWLRGVHPDSTNNSGLRQRTKPNPDGSQSAVPTRQGDIANSNVVYVGRPSSALYTANKTYQAFQNTRGNRTPLVYVGGNDGLFHGFDANTGDEKVAYAPLGAIPLVPALSDPNYSHIYSVDGKPFAADAKINGNWRTVMTSSMGAGGKGYFVLDITDPSVFTPSMSDSNITATVKADLTSPTACTSANTSDVNCDIGHIFAEPTMFTGINSDTSAQVFTLNNGEPAIILGNGYNSANQRPALLIHNLTTNTVTSIPVTKPGATVVGDGNGLSAPRPIDINGDLTPDVVYAGDLKGNLWKFDISSESVSDWKVAFDNEPLHRALGPNGAAQPISTAPVAKAKDGKLIVAYATGRKLTSDDLNDTSVQTIYGVQDNQAVSFASNNAVTAINGGSIITAGRSRLIAQSFTSPNGTENGVTYTGSSNLAVEYSDTVRGWYIDLPDSGERSLKNLNLLNDQYLLAITTVPSANATTADETCEQNLLLQKGFVNLLNMDNGGGPQTNLFGTNFNLAIQNNNSRAGGDLLGGPLFDINAAGSSGDNKTKICGQNGCVDIQMNNKPLDSAGWRVQN